MKHGEVTAWEQIVLRREVAELREARQRRLASELDALEKASKRRRTLATCRGFPPYWKQLRLPEMP